MSSPCYSESVAILRIFDQVGHYPTYSNTLTEMISVLSSPVGPHGGPQEGALGALHVLEEHIAL